VTHGVLDQWLQQQTRHQSPAEALIDLHDDAEAIAVSDAWMSHSAAHVQFALQCPSLIDALHRQAEAGSPSFASTSRGGLGILLEPANTVFNVLKKEMRMELHAQHVELGRWPGAWPRSLPPRSRRAVKGGLQ